MCASFQIQLKVDGVRTVPVWPVVDAHCLKWERPCLNRSEEDHVKALPMKRESLVKNTGTFRGLEAWVNHNTEYPYIISAIRIEKPIWSTDNLSDKSKIPCCPIQELEWQVKHMHIVSTRDRDLSSFTQRASEPANLC
jgi:hypothetical protein